MSYSIPTPTELAAEYDVPTATVEDAIDSALQTARDEDGWNSLPAIGDITPLIWNRISSDVEGILEQERDA